MRKVCKLSTIVVSRRKINKVVLSIFFLLATNDTSDQDTRDQSDLKGDKFN